MRIARCPLASRALGASISTVFALISPAVGFAQSESATLASLRACLSVELTQARLACFDRLFADEAETANRLEPDLTISLDSLTQPEQDIEAGDLVTIVEVSEVDRVKPGSSQKQVSCSLRSAVVAILCSTRRSRSGLWSKKARWVAGFSKV